MSMDIYDLPLPTEQEAKQAVEKTRLMASAALPVVLADVLQTAFDPATSFKEKQATLEFLYKTSGMAEKQAVKPTGPSFSIEIVLPGSNQGITLGAVAQTPQLPTIDHGPTSTSEDDEPQWEMLDSVPDYIGEF